MSFSKYSFSGTVNGRRFPSVPPEKATVKRWVPNQDSATREKVSRWLALVGVYEAEEVQYDPETEVSVVLKTWGTYCVDRMVVKSHERVSSSLDKEKEPISKIFDTFLNGPARVHGKLNRPRKNYRDEPVVSRLAIGDNNRAIVKKKY